MTEKASEITLGAFVLSNRWCGVQVLIYLWLGYFFLRLIRLAEGRARHDMRREGINPVFVKEGHEKTL